MKQKLLLVALLSLPMMASAGVFNPLSPSANAQQGQLQAQGQAQLNMQGNKQTASQSAAFEAQAAQILNINESRRPVNSVQIPGSFSMNECMGSSAAGFGNRLFSLGGSTNWTNEACQKMKVARDLDIAGMKEDALFIRCSIDMLANAPTCVKLRDAVAAVPVE